MKTYGTSHMTRHMKNCKNRISSDKKQQTLTTALNKANNVTIHKFDQNECRRAVAEMIILHEHPFNLVREEGFIKLCKTLQP